MTTLKYINISLETFGVLISLIIIVCILISENRRSQLNRLYIRALIFNIMALVSDSFAWGFKGIVEPYAIVIVHVANFSVFCSGYLMLSSFTRYLVTYIRTKTPVTKFIVYVTDSICGISILLLIISQFNHMYYYIDESNIYHRQANWFWMSQAWPILAMLIIAGVTIYYRKPLGRHDTLILLTYVAIPVAALVVQIKLYGLALLYVATILSALAVYINIQVEQSKILKEKELELAESRIDIMLSQIRPHFLYNALSGIAALCDLDPTKARDAIIDFSVYLRNNLNSLNETKMVTFQKELSYIEVYLKLEKMRFEDGLTIVYHIGAKDFELPLLTVQPIVENAVQYGASKRPDGGTVTITTTESNKDYQICVSDNGPGYNGVNDFDDDTPHVGIKNVKQRLWAQCKGTLTIDSQENEGTNVLIKIPKIS